nr:DNA helicase [Tanacetum cinerariifolium]
MSSATDATTTLIEALLSHRWKTINSERKKRLARGKRRMRITARVFIWSPITRDEGMFITMHTLLTYLQTTATDQLPVVVVLLLQLDLLVVKISVLQVGDEGGGVDGGVAVVVAAVGCGGVQWCRRRGSGGVGWCWWFGGAAAAAMAAVAGVVLWHVRESGIIDRFRAIIFFITMKTKRKLVPKDVVMGNVGELKIVGITGSCVSHVGEGSRPSIPTGSQLECLVGRVVDGRHIGNINDAGLCSAGTSLNDTQKRSRHTTTVLANTDGNGCSSSKSRRTSVDHTVSHLGTSNAVFVPPIDPLFNTVSYSHLHVPNERNPTQESVASLSANQNRTRDVMSRMTTSNVGSSSSSTRRRLHSVRHSANISVSNDDSVFLADTSNVYTNDFSLRGNRTGPPLEYKDVGKYDHSCEHCGARFWYEECIKDNRRKTHPTYHRCCMAGRVVLRTYQIYPEYIYSFCYGIVTLWRTYEGQLYHWLGSLCPAKGDPPRFLHLYVYDTENEVDNRMAHFGGDNSSLRRDIVEGLIELLDNHNALVQLFRTAREKLLKSEVPPFKFRLFNVVGALEYELPTGDMLGEIVYEPGPNAEMDFDIVIKQRIGQPQRVSKLHPSYMALQFSLLFVHSEDGSLNYLSRTGWHFQQYMVTTFCAAEQSRINYIRDHQNDIRNDYLSGIYDAIKREDSNGFDCGGRFILPQSFTGGPRYIVTTTDRADIVDCVFPMKIHQFVKYLRDSKPFGKIIAIVYTVKFQKHGLPHCHTLVWIDKASRTQNQEEIDKYIFAKLPSEKVDPEGHRVVAEFMIHSLCGEICPTTACMKNSSRCTKHFPKEYCHNTYIDAAGFVHY